MAKGGVQYKGNGNLTYGECMLPGAEVSLNIGSPTKTHEGVEYTETINPVTVNAVTDGNPPWSGDCDQLLSTDKHNWPGYGVYYPKEAKVVFFSCSIKDGQADGNAFLAGEGDDLYFEGEYDCFGEDNTRVYSMAFSVFPTAP